jgi:SPOR domain
VDQAGAQAEWHVLQRKLSSLLAGKKPEIVPAVVDGQNIWRVRLGGFATAQAAQAFCAQVIADGGACMVAAS